MKPEKNIQKLYRTLDPVMIVEDTLANQIILQDLVSVFGLESEVAENGRIALDKIAEKNYSVFIVDLMMPIMDGKTFIQELKKIQPDSVILVQTALDSSSTIIEVMKLGVFDYIIKPIDPQVFISTLEKCLDYTNLKQMEKNITLKAGLRLRSQIEWLNYKDLKRTMSEDSIETMSIKNLKDSLSQGTGIGALVTLIDLMTSTMKETESGEEYIVKKNLVDMIKQNTVSVNNMIEGIINISNILQQDVPLETKHASEVIDKIPDTLKNIVPHLIKKKIKITYPELKANCLLKINMAKILDIINELVLNAYKYSPHNSTINVLTYMKEAYFCVSIKNDIMEKPYGGVPKEYEKVVIEPFFRLLPPDETVSSIEKFPMGLGLTVVDYVVRKHSGLFFIHNILDYTGSGGRTCVLAEIFLPVESIL